MKAVRLHCQFINMQPPPHQLAYSGNLEALRALPPGPLFQSLSPPPRPEQTVLYSACRSPNTSIQLVSLLIDKGCIVNQPNGPAALLSCPQHAAVQSLSEVVERLQKQVTPPDLNFVKTLLDVLNILKSRCTNMGAMNQYPMTALQEFQKFQANMSACQAVAHFVPHFVEVLSPAPPSPTVHHPYYAPIHSASKAHRNAFQLHLSAVVRL